MENDSDLKGGSESSEDEVNAQKNFYQNEHMWKSTFVQREEYKQVTPAERANTITPIIDGIGGCWG